ncbi:uncharacterized protein I206_101561 [Kwoniella pini CBS 10737]
MGIHLKLIFDNFNDFNDDFSSSFSSSIERKGKKKNKNKNKQININQLSLSIQNTFVTSNEEPHPLDPEPLPLPIKRINPDDTQVNRTIQAGLLKALPININPSQIYSELSIVKRDRSSINSFKSILKFDSNSSSSSITKKENNHIVIPSISAYRIKRIDGTNLMNVHNFDSRFTKFENQQIPLTSNKFQKYSPMKSSFNIGYNSDQRSKRWKERKKNIDLKIIINNNNHKDLINSALQTNLIISSNIKTTITPYKIYKNIPIYKSNKKYKIGTFTPITNSFKKNKNKHNKMIQNYNNEFNYFKNKNKDKNENENENENQISIPHTGRFQTNLIQPF